MALIPGDSTVAASSVVVYDIIGTYIRPLTGKQVVYWSHILIGKLAQRDLHTGRGVIPRRKA